MGASISSNIFMKSSDALTSSLGEAPIWRQATAQKRRETPMGQQRQSS